MLDTCSTNAKDIDCENLYLNVEGVAGNVDRYYF